MGHRFGQFISAALIATGGFLAISVIGIVARGSAPSTVSKMSWEAPAATADLGFAACINKLNGKLRAISGTQTSSPADREKMRDRAFWECGFQAGIWLRPGPRGPAPAAQPKASVLPYYPNAGDSR